MSALPFDQAGVGDQGTSMWHRSKLLLAGVHYEQGPDVNQIIRSVVTSLRPMGVRVGGVIQEAEIDAEGRCRQLNIVDIRSGRSARITQDRGKEALGCKLDARGLAEITPCITDALDAGADLIVINKFGRAEAEGRGLLPCIADAISRGIPVLTTVRDPYLEAWRAYHGGIAAELLPSFIPILGWCEAAARASRQERATACAGQAPRAAPPEHLLDQHSDRSSPSPAA